MSARRLLGTMRHSQGDVGLLWGGSEWMETFEYPSLFLSPLTFLPLSFCLSFSCWFHLVATFSLCCIFPLFPCLSVKHSAWATNISDLLCWLTVVFHYKMITMAWYGDPFSLCIYFLFIYGSQVALWNFLPKAKSTAVTASQIKATMFRTPASCQQQQFSALQVCA